MIASPLGARIRGAPALRRNGDQDSVDQRQQLAETSWRLIQQNPWFGNPFVLLQMEELRTGDGIIDLVNGYVQVALFYGLVGLALFWRFVLGSLYKSYVTLRRSRRGGRRRDGLVGRELDGMHGRLAVPYGHVGTALPAVGISGSPGRFRGLGGGRAKGGYRRRRSETGVQRRAHGHQLTFERLTEASASRRSCIEAMRETSTTYELF